MPTQTQPTLRYEVSVLGSVLSISALEKIFCSALVAILFGFATGLRFSLEAHVQRNEKVGACFYQVREDVCWRDSS